MTSVFARTSWDPLANSNISYLFAITVAMSSRRISVPSTDYFSSDREPPPTLGIGTTNLASNNPFRNRATSPAGSLPSPSQAAFTLPAIAPERPISKNPFLDLHETKEPSTVHARSTTPPDTDFNANTTASPTKPLLSAHTAELFVRLHATRRGIKINHAIGRSEHQ